MVPSHDKQLHSLSFAMLVIEAQNAPNFSALCCLRRLKRNITTRKAINKLQSTMDSFCQ